jgi:hypothetical protein
VKNLKDVDLTDILNKTQQKTLQRVALKRNIKIAYKIKNVRTQKSKKGCTQKAKRVHPKS